MTVAMSDVLRAFEKAGVGVVELHGEEGRPGPPVEIDGVEQDSREVGPGDLFVAWAGAASDGHDYLSEAWSSGAVAAVVERAVPDVDIPQIQVDNARLAAAVASDLAWGSPWKALQTVAVTGTNGKTTTAFILRSLLAEAYPTAAIGTLGVVGADGKPDPATEGLTTPGPVQLATWVAALEDRGVRGVVLEASSHALDQFRLHGLRFDVVAFTNLTRDHLDYHPDWAHYFAAKARLLDLVKERATAVVNADDPAWAGLAPSCPRLTYGLDGGADVRGSHVTTTLQGSTFRLSYEGSEVPVVLPLPGRFNVYNALAAGACALAMGRSLEQVAEGLARIPQIPGRLERVPSPRFDVLIDFAHTPDALDRVLETLAPLVLGRLIVVFGAGGDRDRAKRPKMGQAVARHADLAVVTSDNPRTEDPTTIVAEVAAGVSGIEAVQIVDRVEAIRWAIDAAEPGDLVLLAGKGHETYQVVGVEKRPFNERRIVLDHLAAGGAQ